MKSNFTLREIFDWHWVSPTQLKSFEFQHPFFLYGILVLPLLFIFRWIWSRYTGKKLKVAFLKNEIKFQWMALLRFIPQLLLILSFSLFIIALARPQRSDESVEKWSEGIDIMLVLDISHSMKGMDFKPNRLEAAKSVAKNFIKGRFQDRIGLVVFSGEAFSKSPLTTDYNLLNAQIDEIKFEDIPSQGTAIGSALAVGLGRLKESTSKTKIVILLSDGDNNAGNLDPIAAAKLAYSFNVKIYAIGVGKTGKVPFPQEYVDIFGNKGVETVMIENNFKETDLKNIASLTDGLYFRATNDKALADIFQKINEFEKTEIKEDRYKSTQDYYLPYLYLGIAMWLLWLLTKSTFISNALED